MDSELPENDIYGLISRLCESLFQQNYHEEEHPYLPHQGNEKHLRKLRSKAYEILLKKSNQDFGEENEPCDPIIELLKHSFVLKTKAGRISQAAELDRYLNDFIDEKVQPDSVTYSTLQFLNCLKSLDFQDDDSLDIFCYGQPHPQLPEMLPDERGISSFQVYPCESFYLPQKFERMFKKEHAYHIRYDASEPGSNLPLLGRFMSSSSSSIQNRHEEDISSKLSVIPKRTTSLLNRTDSNLSTYFLPQIKDINVEEDELQVCKEGIVTEPESPWQCQDPIYWFAQHTRGAFDNQTEISELEENAEKQKVNFDKIWEDMDKFSPLPNHRTWETFGVFNPPPEPPFISESIEATAHLMNVVQDNVLLLQDTVQPNTEVPLKEFLSDAKLMLLGVESNTFIYKSVTGFQLKKNISVHGVSSSTLENVCSEITCWGSCFKNISDLTSPITETGKLQIDGLIFKALCRSIKEFLLFYHAAILKIPIIDDESTGLLRFLNKVRPLGNFILKVAQLCRCDSQRLPSLGEGLGILTHIYREVTKVTERNVALIFYSLLKDCCEVYYRFLQQWIFEGVFIDIYDEFMIKVQPQYLRTRGHRFWTRAFSINHNSVPGFLSELTDSILQCGKAITLLRICNPQHPLCRFSASSQPQVRVCLSVGVLREQARFYEDYVRKCKLEQGEEVTIYLAIQEQKEAEKNRAELVIAAQQDTLLRLKKEREDALRKIAKEKNQLLIQLKEQVEEAALRKVKARDAELLADKLLLEKMLKDEEEAKNNERLERENALKYYNELAEESTKRRIHAEWRIRRMKLFDERVNAIASSRREYMNTPDAEKEFTEENKEVEKSKENNNVQEPERSEQTVNTETSIKETENVDALETPSGNNDDVISEDENSNPTSANIDETKTENNKVSTVDEKNKNLNVINQNANIEQPTTTKAIRPTVLDISGAKTQKYSKDFDKLKATYNLRQIENLTAAQRNKLKVLQHEYGITPNNNETNTILQALENRTDLTDIETNRLRNTRHLTGFESGTMSQNVNEITEEKTDIQMNRLRNTQHLTGFEPATISQNENETTEEKTDIQINRLRNTQHLTGFEPGTMSQNVNEITEGKTDIQMNRLRNTQHLTGFDWDNHEVETPSEDRNLTEAEMNRNKVMSHFYNRMDELEQVPSKSNENEHQVKTEIQMNRLRNTQHLTHLNWKDHEIETPLEKHPLTEAEINRNKVMSHFYNCMDELEQVPTKSNKLTECQRNRNRNMTSNIEKQFDFEMPRTVEHEHLKDTPMSTTTDHFTVSTRSSSSNHAQSCENTPFSETYNHSDIMCARSSDGMSTDEPSHSRASKYFQNTPAFPNFIGFGSIPNTPSTESQQLTVSDVEMISSTSLKVYLEKSVIIPLTAQSTLVNSAIIKCLLSEHNMLSHLHSLRSYFFLLNGEFAKTLMQSLFTRLYEVSMPLEIFSSSTLTNFLEKALVSSLSSTYANSELLSLTVENAIPAILQTSNPEVLSCLSLNYKISWPLNIIFHDIVMQQYNKVFKFLLMVGRVLWVLQEDFHILKAERKTSIAKNHHKLQLYRHSMMQFINALQTYLTCSVLHASWSEFERELENAKTLDEVYDTHVRYIKRILSRCMLNVKGEKMRTCLNNIFRVVLKFHNRIRVHNWSDPKSAGPNYENLEKMYVNFCEQRAYLVHVAEKLANSGYQPHLMQFLDALNINPSYNLTIKK